MPFPLRHPAVLTALLLLSGLSAHAQIMLRRNEIREAPFEFSNGQCTLVLTSRGQLLIGESDEYGHGWEPYCEMGSNVNVGPGEKIFMILQGDNNLCIYKRPANGRNQLLWNTGIVEDPRIECVAELNWKSLVLSHAKGGKVKWKKPSNR